MNTTIEALKMQWKDICNLYLSEFAKKHDYDIEDEIKSGYVWAADNPGTVAQIGDMFVNMNDIRYDIDNNIPEDYFEKWYWKSVDRGFMRLKYMNYYAFCNGAPDPISDEKMKSIIEAKKRLETAENIFNEAIKDYTTDEF